MCPDPANNTVQPEGLGPLIADDSTSDYDSESLASSTQSLTDSIREHVYENGRRYHRKSQGQYAMPTDEAEQDRLDLQHHLYLELLGGNLTLAKFKEPPHRVLDCGTGTGIWALDFGEIYPSSDVTGVDLAPIQPSWTYPNVHFEVDDLEKEWTYKPDYFDFIHSRDVAMAIKDWGRYISQIYKHAAPGATVEIAENCLEKFFCDDGTYPEDSALNKWSAAFCPSVAKMGAHPYNTSADYKRWLEEAGFINIQVHEFKIPLGSWPRNKKAKRMGQILGELATTGFEAFGQMMLTRFAGWSVDDAAKLIKDCVDTVNSNKQHVYYRYWQLVAQKPE